MPPHFPSIPIHRFSLSFGLVAALLLGLSTLSLFGADSFDPLSIPLQPQAALPATPSWETGKVAVHPDSDEVLIPVPSLASQDEIGCFALTVVFQDNGDGGPVVEWLPQEGPAVLLSAGLGQTGLALGLNARTLLITQSLALDGGTIRISYAGRFTRLLSVTLRPARELSVAALGADFSPALLSENEPNLTAGQVTGNDEVLTGGDRTEGQVVHAELSTDPKLLASSNSSGELEFIIPLATQPQACLLQTEVAGLDPESQIEVSVNGETLSPLGAAPFSLTAPNTLLSSSGRLQIAGWHPTYLLIPARLLQPGDNSLVLTLHRVIGDEGNPVYLRKARVDLLFGRGSGTSSSQSPAQPSPASTPLPDSTPSSTPEPTPTATPIETLSTGSSYGNPSPTLFHATLPPPAFK